MTSLQDLEAFIVVATSGSFAAAARRLSISPAMVGRRVQALEERYGVKLIERTTRSQRLTEVGEHFLAKSMEVIETVEELGEIARPETAQIAGRLRISAPVTLGIKRITPILASLADKYPSVAIELNLGDRKVDIISEGYDFAIRIGELKSSSLIARRLGDYGFVCCASPGYLERHGEPGTPSDLETAHCVLNLNIVPRNRWHFFDDRGERLVVEVTGGLEIDNGEGLRAAALAGAGIIYAPVDLVSEDIAEGALRPVLKAWKTMTLPIHALHPSRRFVPRRVSVVIDAIARGMK